MFQQLPEGFESQMKRLLGEAGFFAYLNALDEEEFQAFVAYHLATCERPDLMGASSHTVDILRKPR